MSSAQKFIDDLRQGLVFNVFDFITYVNEKYKKLKDPIAADDLVQLGVYELSLTDIKEQDIIAINFLYNFSHLAPESILAGEVGYILASFVCMASNALSLKMHYSFPEIVRDINIHNANQLEALCKEQSSFGQLEQEQLHISVALRRLMTHPVSYSDLVDECRKMDRRVFLNLKHNTNRLAPEMVNKLEVVFSTLMEEERRVTRLKEIVNDFKRHLQNKTEHNASLQKSKNVKLWTRYQTVLQLDEHLKNKTYMDEQLIHAVKTALQSIKGKHTTWSERDPSQKVTDLISVGLKPMYRSFFSREHSYEEEIIKLCGFSEESLSYTTEYRPS